MEGIEVLEIIIDGLAFGMLVLSLALAAAPAIMHMIRIYQIQAVLLLLLTLLVALEPQNGAARLALVTFALLIPGLLAYMIRPLLAQATIPEDIHWLRRLAGPALRAFHPGYRQAAAKSLRAAIPIWLRHEIPPKRQAASILMSLALTGFVYIVAFHLSQIPLFGINRFATAVSMVSVGLLIMIFRRDLISQVLGLLVVDQGLFLAAIRLAPLPEMIPAFTYALLFYIPITLAMLVGLLPELHARSQTILVAEQDRLRG